VGLKKYGGGGCNGSSALWELAARKDVAKKHQPSGGKGERQRVEGGIHEISASQKGNNGGKEQKSKKRN